jgi:hypothetical protein
MRRARYAKIAQEITLARVLQAGVVPMDTAAVASELQQTWNRPDAPEWAKVYTMIFPPYQLRIESYQTAREVEQKHETLDRCEPDAAASDCSAAAQPKGCPMPHIRIQREDTGSKGPYVVRID